MPDFLISYQSLIVSVVITVVLLALAIALFKIFEQVWLFYKQSLYKKAIKWTVLELRIPREVLKTPKAMEQFFINLHSLKNEPGNFLEKYTDGEVTLWWSLEIASLGGKIHFYIRTPKKHRKMFEAGMHAQYPNIEIIETEDYLNKLPSSTKEFYESNENIFGSEFNLGKKDFYPIITYDHFFNQPAKLDDQKQVIVDPLSALIEVLAGIHKEENVFIQILIAPLNDDWKNEGRDFVNKKLGKEEKKKGGFNQIIYEWTKNFLWAPTEYPVWSEPKEPAKKEPANISDYEAMKEIENKLSKHGFESLIRFLYIAPNSIYSTNFARKGILGAFNQYASSLNFFKNNPLVETRTRWIYSPHVFVKQRVEARKQRLLYNFKNRLFPEKLSFGKFMTSHIFDFNNKSKTSVFVTSELATIYHIPAEQVLTSPHIERAESKKMGPPAGLPIFEEE
ncbi:MAG: hypothetical protein AAB504_00880 [Patescibacteria group bacterium]